MMHHQKYPKYKVSGVSWLDNIPEHWQLRRLKFSAPLQNYKSTTKSDELPYIGLEHIESGTGKLLDTSNTSEVESTVSLFQTGDVLFNKLRPYLAKVHLTQYPGACTSELLVLRPAEDIKSRFLFYYLLSDPIIRTVDSFTYGAKMPRVNWEQIANLPVAVATLSEQQAIVDFLDRETVIIDILVAKKQQLIQVLQKQRMALISHAVTKGLDPNVQMKESGIDWLGEIPKHWKVVLIKRHYEVALGKMLNASTQLGHEERKPYLRAANVKWEGIDIEDINMMEFSAQQRGRYRLFQGDLLVTEGGVTVGRSAIWEGQIEECYYQNSLNRVRRRSGLSTKFLYYWMYFLKESGYIDLISDKATFGHLTNEELSALPVVVVPSSEESKILDYLDSQLAHIAEITELTNKAIKKLQQYRVTLISSAVTGKIDVRNR